MKHLKTIGTVLVIVAVVVLVLWLIGAPARAAAMEAIAPTTGPTG